MTSGSTLSAPRGRSGAIRIVPSAARNRIPSSTGPNPTDQAFPSVRSQPERSGSGEMALLMRTQPSSVS